MVARSKQNIHHPSIRNLITSQSQGLFLWPQPQPPAGLKRVSRWGGASTEHPWSAGFPHPPAMTGSAQATVFVTAPCSLSLQKRDLWPDSGAERSPKTGSFSDGETPMLHYVHKLDSYSGSE